MIVIKLFQTKIKKIEGLHWDLRKDTTPNSVSMVESHL